MKDKTRIGLILIGIILTILLGLLAAVFLKDCKSGRFPYISGGAASPESQPALRE